MTGPSGVLQLLGRLPDASNGTFLAQDDEGSRWVYKPVAGELPLWDFPSGTLGRREVAAFALAEFCGLNLVPETVWVDGPFGEGSAQRWVDGLPTDLVDVVAPSAVGGDWLPIVAGLDGNDETVILVHRDDGQLRSVALFDALLNNSDRKGSHLISAEEGLFGVDHGVSMHVENKLRTVLWGWTGNPLTESELATVRVVAGLGKPLSDGLSSAEWEALISRAAKLLAVGAFPEPSDRWPAIPWPPI